MASLLILYPKIFKSYSKFKRHVKKYTNNPDDPKNFELYFLNDSNSYIKNISVDLSNLSLGRKVDSIDEIEFDYAAYTSENLTRLNMAILDFQNI